MGSNSTMTTTFFPCRMVLSKVPWAWKSVGQSEGGSYSETEHWQVDWCSDQVPMVQLQADISLSALLLNKLYTWGVEGDDMFPAQSSLISLHYWSRVFAQFQGWVVFIKVFYNAVKISLSRWDLDSHLVAYFAQYSMTLQRDTQYCISH